MLSIAAEFTRSGLRLRLRSSTTASLCCCMCLSAIERIGAAPEGGISQRTAVPR